MLEEYSGIQEYLRGFLEGSTTHCELAWHNLPENNVFRNSYCKYTELRLCSDCVS